MSHVPYKGGAAVFSDLLAGHIQFAFTTVPSMLEHIRAGGVRALAVTGDQRSPLLPDVPSMAESGLKEVDAASSVRDGPLRDELLEMGFTPVGSSDAEFRSRIDGEIEKWTRVVRTAKIQPDK